MKNYGKLSRYDAGVVTISHKNANVTTSVGTLMDDTVANLDNTLQYSRGRIPVMHQHRPDLISNTFYDSPRYWWLIMHFNDIPDPFEGLNSGDPILIPNIDE
jgi:hypothetical protein